jgi:D-alanyl-D-alanine carboxypeptidase/D-alanyl-D-alanine-endopeptidase (penicillin-binding protein 4)
VLTRPLSAASIFTDERYPEDPLQQSLLVETLFGREVLAERNPDLPLNPASVMKLATSLVAFERFGPDHRFRTRILRDGPVDPRSGALLGDLVIDGGYDPLFSDRETGEVATTLQAAGISSVNGGLRVSARFYYFGARMRSSATVAQSAHLLRESFIKAGLPIRRQASVGEVSGIEIAAHDSARLESILLFQNAWSSNAVAEVVGESVGGPRAIEDSLKTELHLQPNELLIGTASGLGSNRMTARAALSILRQLFRSLMKQRMRPDAILPVAGVDTSTLAARLGEATHGAVVAKTGTLNSVSTLAGIAYTRRDGVLLFAVFGNGAPPGELRLVQSRFVDDLIAEEGGGDGMLRSADGASGPPAGTAGRVRRDQ